MNDRGFTDGVSSKPILATEVFKWEWFALFYARFALGAAFLSFGLCREAATYYSPGLFQVR